MLNNAKRRRLGIVAILSPSGRVYLADQEFEIRQELVVAHRCTLKRAYCIDPSRNVPGSSRSELGNARATSAPDLLALITIKRRPLVALSPIAAVTISAFVSIEPSSKVSTKKQWNPTFCNAARGTARSAPVSVSRLYR